MSCQHLLSLGRCCETEGQAHGDVRETPGARRPTPGFRKCVVKIELEILVWGGRGKERGPEWGSEFRSHGVCTGGNRIKQVSAGLESQLGRKGKREEAGGWSPEPGLAGDAPLEEHLQRERWAETLVHQDPSWRKLSFLGTSCAHNHKPEGGRFKIVGIASSLSVANYYHYYNWAGN